MAFGALLAVAGLVGVVLDPFNTSRRGTPQWFSGGTVVVCGVFIVLYAARYGRK